MSVFLRKNIDNGSSVIVSNKVDILRNDEMYLLQSETDVSEKNKNQNKC